MIKNETKILLTEDTRKLQQHLTTFSPSNTSAAVALQRLVFTLCTLTLLVNLRLILLCLLFLVNIKYYCLIQVMVVLRNKTIWQNKITDCIIDYVSFIYGSGYNTGLQQKILFSGFAVLFSGFAVLYRTIIIISVRAERIRNNLVKLHILSRGCSLRCWSSQTAQATICNLGFCKSLQSHGQNNSYKKKEQNCCKNTAAVYTHEETQ